MGLSHMLLPAFLVHISSASSTVVDMGSSFLSANRAIHCLPPAVILGRLLTDSKGDYGDNNK